MTRKIMSRQIPKAEGNEKLVANKLDVAKQDIYIAIRLPNENSVSTESKNKPREQVATENNKQQQKQ